MSCLQKKRLESDVSNVKVVLWECKCWRFLTGSEQNVPFYSRSSTMQLFRMKRSFFFLFFSLIHLKKHAVAFFILSNIIVSRPEENTKESGFHGKEGVEWKKDGFRKPKGENISEIQNSKTGKFDELQANTGTRLRLSNLEYRQ